MTEIKYNIRLKDPEKILSSKKFDEYNEKIAINYQRLSFPAKYGGNPFAFAIAANKFHIINNKLEPPTAATDGINIYWHQNRLEELSVDELFFVLEHEILHIALGHTFAKRMSNKIRLLWNIAADFKVNSIQERTFLTRHNIEKTDSFNHPLWKGTLGVPISLNEIKNVISKKEIDPRKYLIKTRPVDLSTLNFTVENIYEQLLKTLKDNNIDIKNDISLEDIGFSNFNLDVDDHQILQITEDELMDKLSHAIEFAKKLNGTIPKETLDFVSELTNPEITWKEYCCAYLKKLKYEGGINRNWTKFKRRFICNDIYIPANIKYKTKFIVLLDTSLSMSREDIAFGISQLQSLANIAEGIVVPVDSKPYWHNSSKIKNIDDVKTISIVGRGGTVFNEFFRDYKKYVGNADFIIVITDGEFGFIDSGFKPNCSVVWVIVNYDKSKTVPFGKILPLYKKRNL